MQAPEQKKMIAETAPSKTKMVKIRALRPIGLPDPANEGKRTNIVPPGTEAEVSEELAAELCDKSFDGTYPMGYVGWTGGPGSKPPVAKIFRAERVA